MPASRRWWRGQVKSAGTTEAGEWCAWCAALSPLVPSRHSRRNDFARPLPCLVVADRGLFTAVGSNSARQGPTLVSTAET
jgi:hypothetical protein